MNRKIYSCLTAIAITLFAVSCSKQEPIALGNEVEVSFFLNTDDIIATSDAAEASQAVSATSKEASSKAARIIPKQNSKNLGKGIDQLTFAIFDEDGNEIFTPKTTREIKSDQLLKGVEIKASLIKGNTYKACFWAQSSKCTAYSISDDMKLTVNYDGVNNDATRDAFFAYTESFTVDVNPRLTVVLKRPFAQINVGTTTEDINAITAVGVKVSKSEARIEDVPTELDLFSGATDNNMDITYTLSNMPTAKLSVDTDGDSIMEEYTHLSMSYILADPIGSTHKMTFVFPDDNGSENIEITNGLEAVPAQRNWRTNILGNILSGNINFKISIDPQFKNDINDVINNININNGAYYCFSEETTIEDCIFVFDNNDSLATFATTGGQLLTVKNVTFTGFIGAISFGEYRQGYDGSRFNHNNYLENVVLTNFTNNYYIEDAGNKVAPSIVVYGNSTLKNCVMKGSKTLAPPEYFCYDLGVTAQANVTIEGGEYGNAYFWARSHTTIQDAKFNKLVIASFYYNAGIQGSTTIKAGTEIDTLKVSYSGGSYRPQFTIEAGAKINVLDYTGIKSTDRSKVSIAEGTVTTINENH